jgi:hypothetical protein
VVKNIVLGKGQELRSLLQSTIPVFSQILNNNHIICVFMPRKIDDVVDC